MDAKQLSNLGNPDVLPKAGQGEAGLPGHAPFAFRSIPAFPLYGARPALQLRPTEPAPQKAAPARVPRQVKVRGSLEAMLAYRAKLQKAGRLLEARAVDQCIELAKAEQKINAQKLKGDV